MPAVPMSVHHAGTNDLLPSGSSSSNSIAPCRRIPPNTRSDVPCNGWRTRVTFTAAGRSLRPVVSRGFVGVPEAGALFGVSVDRAQQ